MPVKVTIAIPKLDLIPPSTVMREVGDLAIRMIRERTAQGRGPDGAAFRSLSPGYAERKREELGHDTADLTVSGRMLNDMAIVAQSPSAVTIGFRSQGGTAPRGRQTLIQRSRAVGAQDKAFWHHTSGAGKSRVRRPFFALNQREAGTIRQRVEAWMRTLAERVSRG